MNAIETTVHDPDECAGYFEPEQALALLLVNEVVFLNSNWWEEGAPDHLQKAISVNVGCNDVFAWGCADGEGPLQYTEIENLYRMWKKDPIWGSAIWCMQKRNEMPQGPVEKRIRAAGIWNLDEMGLRPNTSDGHAKAQFAKLAASLSPPHRHVTEDL